MGLNSINIRAISPEDFSTSINVNLEFASASPTDPYILKDASGLGPPDIDLMFTDNLYSGGSYLGEKYKDREPVLRILLNPNYALGQTAETLRKKLYKMLSTRSTLYLDLAGKDDEGYYLRFLSVRVKRFEVVPFSKDPEIQITFTARNPFIWSFSSDVYATPTNFSYSGTAPAGVVGQLVINETITTSSKLCLQVGPSRGNLGNQFMQLDSAFAIGDRLSFNTKDGEKSIKKITSGGVTTEISGYLNPIYKSWLKVYPGVNKFWVSKTDYLTAVNVTWESLVYTPLYWGV